MNTSNIRAKRFVMAPLLSVALLASAVAMVNAVAPSDMIAKDSGIEIVDGKHVQELTREMAFAPGSRLNIVSGNGQIAVSGSDDNKLVIRATKKMERRVGGVGWIMNKLNIGFNTSEDVESFFKEVTLDVRAVEGGIDVETIIPKSRPNVNVRIDYEIMLPKQAMLALETSNGTISIIDIEGEIVSRSSNGKISIERVSGTVEAKTSNGSVVLTNIAGAVRANTSNGSIIVEQNRILTADNTIYCKTSNGSVKVRVPEASSFDLDASTSNGSVNCSFPIASDSTPESKRHRKGRVGDGGPLVELHTSNGSILVTES